MSESEKKKRQNLKERLISDPTRVITLANLISLLRAFSAIPIIYSMANPYWGGASGGTQTAAIAAGGAKTPGPQTDITEEFTGVTETVTAKTLTTS